MKVLLLDIETAPNLVYVWGLWNQNVAVNQIVEPGYTLCWAAKWLGEDTVFFNSVNNTDAKEMLKEIHALLTEADVVVHYYGSKFDIPTLNKEFITYGMKPPAGYKQIDLLKVAKSQFKFPSNKLNYITKALRLGSKVEHKGHDLWTECMRGRRDAWKKMKEYNIQDVLLLEALYNRMLPWIKNHPNRNLYVQGNSRVCPNCGSSALTKRGYSRTSVSVFERFQCKKCGKWSRGRDNQLPKDKLKTIVVEDK